MARFVEEYLGIAGEQPAQYARLRRMRRSIYRPLGTLTTTAFRSPEPVSFAHLEPSTFTPIRPGDSWGGRFDCAWLHLTGEVPTAALPAAGAERVVAMLGIRGEGLVHAPDGSVLGSTSTVWQQADLPHPGGRFRVLDGVDLTTGSVDIYVDATYNGFLLWNLGRPRFFGAVLAIEDAQRLAHYYDYLTLSVLARHTDDTALARELRRALTVSWRCWRADDVSGARAALADALAAPSDSDFEYSAVGHGHLDMAWLWPVRETRRKAARTYARALNLADAHPEYIYGTSQPQQLAWTKERYPELYERIRRAVADGRIELQGAFWVEPDTNMPSGESLVRQALVGNAFLRDEFGVAPRRLCWLPDTFGYSGALPQILKKSGMDWFQTIKLSWNTQTVFPYRTFRWAGIDGSEVLVHMPPEGDYNSRGAPDGLLRGLARYPERALGTALLVYGSGDGGGGPGDVHLAVTERERNLRGLPRVRRSSAHDFFAQLATRRIEHRHTGELYLETHQGCYTTAAQNKRHNRLTERLLHEAEALATVAGANSRERLLPAWRGALLNQFHDILPGSAIERVNREAIASWRAIEESTEAYITELLGELAGDREGGIVAVPTAVNLTSFARDEWMRVNDDWFRARVDAYAASPLILLDGLSHDGGTGSHNEVGLGLAHTADTISNDLLTLRFDATGAIDSCLDRDGVEHAASGLNRLVIHRDPFQFPWDAWNISLAYTRRRARALRPVRVSTVIEGPTVVRTHVFEERECSIRQRVVLEAGSLVVRFETDVDWHTSHRMLRAEFRPARFGASAECEIQFGHIARATTENDARERAQFEVCAHKWIATSTDEGGFAVLNDSKYGHRAKNGLISLALLRSPTFPDRTVDRGRHRFSYAFMPFANGDLGAVVREGYRLNNPLRLTDGVTFESLVRTENPGIVIETVKPAEDGSGTIVRMYESLGRATTTALRARGDHTHAYVTDLMENVLVPADLDALTFGPFEIVTILLTRRARPVRDASSTREEVVG